MLFRLGLCVRDVDLVRQKMRPVVGGVEAPRSNPLRFVRVRFVGQRVVFDPAGDGYGVEAFVGLLDLDPWFADDW